MYLCMAGETEPIIQQFLSQCLTFLRTQPHVGRALEELRSLCAFYKVLGTYPVTA